MNTPNAPTYSSPQSSGPNPPLRHPGGVTRSKVAIVAVVGVFAIIVTALLLILVNGGPAEGATASATPSPSSSTASSSQARPRPNRPPQPNRHPPSTLADRVGIRRAERSTTGRAHAGLGPHQDRPQPPRRRERRNAIVANLAPGEVVWVNSGPYREDADDQLDWYNVETLNDKYGWIASGSPDDPNATTISQQFRFRSCGPVGISGSQGVVNGLRTPRLNDVESPPSSWRSRWALGAACGFPTRTTSPR